MSLSNRTNYRGYLTTFSQTYHIDQDATVTFTGIKLTDIGQISFVFECKTFLENRYSFKSESNVFKVTRPEDEVPVVEAEKVLEMKFEEDFAVVYGVEDWFIAVVDNYLSHTFTKVMCDNYTLWQGMGSDICT